MKKVVNKEDVYVAHEETRNKNHTMGEIPNAQRASQAYTNPAIPFTLTR